MSISRKQTLWNSYVVKWFSNETLDVLAKNDNVCLALKKVHNAINLIRDLVLMSLARADLPRYIHPSASSCLEMPP
jgi:hypothetical protein